MKEIKESNCDVCGKIFRNTNPKTSLQKHKLFCNDVQNFLNKYDLNPANLASEYERLGSVLAFQTKYPFKSHFVFYYKMFKFLDVKVSVATASNNEATKARRRATSLKNCGFEHNFCRDNPSRLAWQQRLLEEENITNVFQREDVKEKIKNTLVEKYGKEYWKNVATSRGANIISGLNKKIFLLLEELNIPFAIEFKLKRPDKNHLYYAYDVLLEGQNKIIEVYEDYWHGNPLIYKPNDLILKNTSAEIKVSDKWVLDKNKEDFAKQHGYEIMVIWESDVSEGIEKVKSRILEFYEAA